MRLLFTLMVVLQLGVNGTVKTLEQKPEAEAKENERVRDAAEQEGNRHV